jgi:hypothetical protein
VICPSDAVAAILKGAVMFGHNSALITERIPLTDRSHINFCVIVKSRLFLKTIKLCLNLPVCTLL